MLVCGLGGAAGAIAPDVLEPALHPNHRSLFHSLAAGGATTAGLKGLYETVSMDPYLRLFARSLLVGYLSHLVLDSSTPRGLPVLS